MIEIPAYIMIAAVIVPVSIIGIRQKFKIENPSHQDLADEDAFFIIGLVAAITLVLYALETFFA